MAKDAVSTPGEHHQWLASSWTLCHLSLLSKPNSQAIFQFHLIVHLSKPYFTSLSVRILSERVPKIIEVKINSIHCSSLICQTGRLIEEGYEVG